MILFNYMVQLFTFLFHWNFSSLNPDNDIVILSNTSHFSHKHCKAPLSFGNERYINLCILILIILNIRKLARVTERRLLALSIPRKILV